VLAFYLSSAAASICAWVCPVNLVTDAAGWLRDRLGIKGGAHVSRSRRATGSSA
jgi:ferredoxin-type protein NapH